jgi:LmbE family N-acetylglucosaminyl deacetylase
MKFNKQIAQIFIPDGTEEITALKRTTHLAISAHQDDIELMAINGVLECFGDKNKWFTGVVTADGAGSSRNGLYENFSDEEIKKVRILEQKKAAYVGEYSAMIMLGYSSKEIKTPQNDKIIDEYVKILTLAQPKILYTHNLADKHNTHLGVVTKVITALRIMPKEIRPEKVYGCEVWRDLDWVKDEEKIIFDVSAHPNISTGLISVFDSQICGGKRYDLAAQGRRTAYATYGASHNCDKATALSYAMDLTPLIEDDNLDLVDYISNYIENFKKDVKDRLNRLYE